MLHADICELGDQEKVLLRENQNVLSFCQLCFVLVSHKYANTECTTSSFLFCCHVT